MAKKVVATLKTGTGKEYSKVIDLLNVWDHPDVTFKINARTLLIRSGLEMFLTDQSWDDVIESNCHSFKRFIQSRFS